MVIRSTLLFSNWGKKSTTDDAVIISSLTVTPETKTSSDSLHFSPVLSLETSVCSTLKFYPVFLGS